MKETQPPSSRVTFGMLSIWGLVVAGWLVCFNFAWGTCLVRTWRRSGTSLQMTTWGGARKTILKPTSAKLRHTSCRIMTVVVQWEIGIKEPLQPTSCGGLLIFWGVFQLILKAFWFSAGWRLTDWIQCLVCFTGAVHSLLKMKLTLFLHKGFSFWTFMVRLHGLCSWLVDNGYSPCIPSCTFFITSCWS